MALDLAQHLLDVEAATRAEIEAALLAASKQRVPFLVALSGLRGGLETQLELELERRFGPALPVANPEAESFAALPVGLCSTLLAFPVGTDSGTVCVLAADPSDARVAAELSFHLESPVRVERGRWRQIVERLQLLEAAPGPLTRRQDALQMNQGPTERAHDSLPPLPLVRRPAWSGSSAELPAVRDVAASPLKLDPTPDDLLVPRPSAPPTGVARSADLLHPGALRMSLSEPGPDELERALGELAVAEAPDQVVEALLLAMAPVCEEAIVFAARGNELISRVRLNYAGQPERFTALSVERNSRCCVTRAIELGQHLAAPSPSDLLLFVGQPAEVCATCVEVEGRPVLVLACGGFKDSFEVSRRSERLGRAAADALGRIVRAKKR